MLPPREEFRRRCVEKGWSPPSEHLLKIVDETYLLPAHFTGDDLTNAMSKYPKRFSRSIVYVVLSRLVKAGMLIQAAPLVGAYQRTT